MQRDGHHDMHDPGPDPDAHGTHHAEPGARGHAAQAEHGHPPEGRTAGSEQGPPHSAEHRRHGAGHVDHTGHESMFRRRFWVSLILTIPVLAYSPMIQAWFGFRAPSFPGSAWVTPVFSIVVFAYGGLPFLRMARPEIRNRRPGMMTLISLAIGVAFVYSLGALVFLSGETFFWELVTLIDIMLLGHWLEMRSVRQASGALQELARLMPDTAERLTPDGRTETVATSHLRSGDIVLIRPGASVPADGEIVEGESHVNEAMITGESSPVEKTPGMRVIAGTINDEGGLRVRVTATGDQTALAGIMRLVKQAQQSKSDTQILADKAAGWLFYLALGVAAVTAVAWIIAVGFDVEVIARVATVLVIACPHALGLAVPLVVSITTALGARNGILVRDRLALEKARLIDTVIFDKTGTLTRGEFGVVGSAVVDGWTEDRALALTAAAEGDSEHTIARAIRRSAEARHLSVPRGSAFEAIKGRGVRATVDGHQLHVGGPRLLEGLQVELPSPLREFQRRAGQKGQTVVFLLQDQSPVAALALADVIRPESRAAIDRLHAMGIQVAMLTGDSRAVAEVVGRELGIDQVFAEVLPEHKDRHVADLQRQGRRVAMVGDGVNDAPALTRADVGIAIGSGTDVAIESAGIILVRSDPLDVVRIFSLSRASYRKMIQNLIWATGYNVVALPLAAGVLAPWGILLSPALGAMFMSLSTVIVAINAQLLRRLSLAG
ncbi:MAG TPA: copper-translocating P-type ATPase [Anaerolineales bacterium]|nr:copper-translocating P-type ATPase [Anaerolineales bacterium]